MKDKDVIEWLTDLSKYVDELANKMHELQGRYFEMELEVKELLERKDA